jgi:acid phosphatase class B
MNDDDDVLKCRDAGLHVIIALPAAQTTTTALPQCFAAYTLPD